MFDLTTAKPVGFDLSTAKPVVETPGTMDKLGHQGGLFVRSLVEGISAVPGIGADALNTIINLGIDAYNKGTNSQLEKLPMATEALSRGLTKAGLAEPQNATERVVLDINKALAGQGAISSAGKVASLKTGSLPMTPVEPAITSELPQVSRIAPRVAGRTEPVLNAVPGVQARSAPFMSEAAGPVSRGVGEVLASRPGLQAITAASGTAAGGLTRESGGSPLVQTAANLGASIAVPGSSGIFRRNPLSPETQALMDEAARRGVDLSYSDITGKGRRLDTMLEQAPVVGTSSFRESGARKATSAMEGYASDIKGRMQDTQYRGLDKLKQAAASGDKSARNTLDQIQNAGEDWTKIMQASGNLKLWRARQDANQLYSRVEKIGNTRGQVPLTETNAALDSAIADESSSKLPDSSLIGVLKKMKGALAGESQTIESPILGIDGKPVWSKTIYKTDNNFSGIRQLRSDIGDLVENYYKGTNAAVGAKGVGKLQSVKNAVESDMEKFATTNGGDLQRAWKRADEFYKLAVIPYKDKALASALKSDLPDEIYRKFIQVSRSGAGEDRAQKFYDALDQKGRAAVRYGMVSNAIDSASIPEKQGLLSPGKFEQSISNIRNASGVFFKGADKSELDGFANLMEHARRFGQYMENPPTGQRVIPWLALGGAAIRPAEMAGVGTAAYITRLLLTTDTGKDLLLSASRLKAGTPEMEKLVQEITKQIPRLAASQNSKETLPERSQTQ